MTDVVVVGERRGRQGRQQPPQVGVVPCRSIAFGGGGGVRGRTELPGYVDEAMKGDIDLDVFITKTMGLEQINDAFDLMHQGQSIRSVIHY